MPLAGALAAPCACRDGLLMGWARATQGASAVPSPLGSFGPAVGFMGVPWCVSLHVIPSL